MSPIWLTKWHGEVMAALVNPRSGPGSELRTAYHRELQELDAGVIRLGAMVCETIPRGTEILLSGDLAS